MRKAHWFVALGLILALWMSGVGAGASLSGPEAMPSSPGSLVSKALEQLALGFEAHDGQSEAGVRFLARGKGYGLFLTSTGAVLTLGRDAQGTPSILQWRFAGASGNPEVTGLDPLAARSNYFIGPDPTKWRTNVPRYARVRYRNLYPGVDLVYHGQRGALEYDFVVAPGASPRAIGWSIEGARRVRLDRQGDLVLEAPGGQIRQRHPVVYQETAAGRQSVKGRFVVRGRNRVGFEIGPYDASRPLVIDPVLEYSTYLGGGGGDYGKAVAVDSSGSAYVTGTARLSFPTANPLQASPPGWTAFVLKLNAQGTELVYSTYLGGEASLEARGIAVDGAGNAYVTGYTASPRFPTVNAFQSSHGGQDDAFVAKLDSTGSRLVYSTYLGGSQIEYAYSIAVDGAGNAYVTGDTRSDNFPTKDPLQAKRGPGTCQFLGSYPCPDAFVSKLDASGSALVYSTYLGGSRTATSSTQYRNGSDAGYGITVDAAGSAYITGETISTNFPTKNPLQANKAGSLDSTDAFVTKLNPAGSALVYSTYLGGAGADRGYAISVDRSGSAHVTGYTDSTDFPTVNPIQVAKAGDSYNTDIFVAKLNPAGSALLYSTYLGGAKYDYGYGIAVDRAGNAWVAGTTSSADFPMVQPLQSADPAGDDAFVSALNASGSALVFSTCLGGRYSRDEAYGIALDASGNAVVVGSSRSYDFPTTPAAFQPKFGGDSDAFVTKLTGLIEPPPGVTAMSAASFSTSALAPESIASAFGSNLATETKVADTVPLPTSLGGSTLTVTDSEGIERRAPLFFVSPGQINFLVPPGTKNGRAQLKVTSASGPAVTGSVPIETVAAGLFSANADAKGVAAGIVTIARADGTQSSELIFRDDAAQHKRVAIPVNLGAAGDTAVLTLFGTGIRFRSDLSAVKVTIGGQECEVLYAGPQGEFAGLDQVNVRLPRSLKGRDELDILLTVEGKRANTVSILFTGKPRITSIAPTSVRVGESVNLTINGTDLEEVDRIEFSPAAGLTVSNLRATANAVTAQVAAAATAATGDRRLSVVGAVRSPDTAAFAVRPKSSSTPFIYNVSVRNDLLSFQTAVFNGEFEFDDADGDIFYTGTVATSAKLEYRISGACTLTFAGSYLNQRGATSGRVYFLVQYQASRLVISSSPSEFRLIDAAGNRSNVILSDFGGYCP